MPNRYNVMVAATTNEGNNYREMYPQFRRHLLLTPESSLPSGLIGAYVWTPDAGNLPASVRLRLRGAMAPRIDEESVEEEFPLTLLSW